MYQNDIVGVARADNSELYQKQSHTLDDSLKIYIGTLSATNSANAATITNDFSSILIGHNDGIFQATATANAEKPAGITSRLEREWKVTNTNFTDDFSLEIEWDSAGTFTLSHIRLLVDDDGDFSDATVYASGDNGMTFSLGSIIISGIPTAVIPSGSTKYITIGSVDAATPLPVELLNFDVDKIGACEAKLTWTTGSEINNSYFEVQRSYDGVSWMTVGQVSGAGNSTDVLNYQYHDVLTCDHKGEVYYRLEQHDFDGESEVSSVRSIDLTSSFSISVYPNPTDGQIAVEINSDNAEINGEIIVQTIEGRELMRYKATDGRNVLDLSSLSPAIYLLQVNIVGQPPHIQRVVKSR